MAGWKVYVPVLCSDPLSSILTQTSFQFHHDSLSLLTSTVRQAFLLQSADCSQAVTSCTTVIPHQHVAALTMHCAAGRVVGQRIFALPSLHEPLPVGAYPLQGRSNTLLRLSGRSAHLAS